MFVTILSTCYIVFVYMSLLFSFLVYHIIYFGYHFIGFGLSITTLITTTLSTYITVFLFQTSQSGACFFFFFFKYKIDQSIVFCILSSSIIFFRLFSSSFSFHPLFSYTVLSSLFSIGIVLQSVQI